MLKYTLGALFAVVILVATGLIILSRVDDSDADLGQAPQIIVVMSNRDLFPLKMEIERGQITELRVDNQRPRTMVLSIEGEGIEQLPRLPGPDDVGSRDPLPYVSLQTSPLRSTSEYVRFNESGEYEAKVYAVGDFFTETIAITVK